MADIIWDSELGPSWPDDWEHTTVHAQFVAVTGDGADSNRLPDIAPSGNGEVIFTPSLRTVRYVGADGPYVVSLKQYRAVVDSEGYLCTPDTFGQPGERGIVLPSTDAPVIEPRGEDDNAFTWRVEFDIPSVNIRSDHIAVPVGGPYNLVDLLSPERAAGVVHIIDRVSARDAKQAAQEATAARDLVLPARDQTLAARDETLQHGITVDTSVGTRVFIGDTMIYGDTGWRNYGADLIGSTPGISRNPFNSRLRREGEKVTFYFYANMVTEGSVAVDGFFPPGFRPRHALTDTAFESLVEPLRPSLWIRANPSGVLSIDTLGGGRGLQRIEATFYTSDSWPTSLPGSPA